MPTTWYGRSSTLPLPVKRKRRITHPRGDAHAPRHCRDARMSCPVTTLRQLRNGTWTTRDIEPVSISEAHNAVLRLAVDYGVRVCVANYAVERVDQPSPPWVAAPALQRPRIRSATVREFSLGPIRAGLRFRRPALLVGTVGAPRLSRLRLFDAEDILHELVHLILGPGSVRPHVCESYLLMPFEWCLARYAARTLPNDLRASFLDVVAQYQEGTTIWWAMPYTMRSEGFEETLLSEVGRDARRMRWWREGVQLAIRLGLLDSHKRPTYKRLMFHESRRLYTAAF